jgi:hypothetical protein
MKKQELQFPKDLDKVILEFSKEGLKIKPIKSESELWKRK